MDIAHDQRRQAEEAAAAWWVGKPFPAASWGRPYLCDLCGAQITAREGTSLVESRLLCPTCTDRSFAQSPPTAPPASWAQPQPQWSTSMPPPPAAMWAPARRRRRWPLIVGAALAAVIGLVIGLIVWAPWVELPKTPTTVAGTSVTASTVSISWKPGAGGPKVDQYVILRDGASVATVPATQTRYVDRGLKPGVTYTYAVKAKAGSRQSGSSAKLRITTAAPSPTGLKAAAVTGTSVSLSWSPPPKSPAPDTYNVIRDGAKIAAVPGGTTTYRDTALTPGVTYKYQVVAVWAGHSSKPSGVLSVNASTHDGSWSGTTSQGLPITFTIANDQVTKVSLKASFTQCPGITVKETYSVMEPVPVQDGHFAVSLSTLTVNGTLDTNTAAHGSASLHPGQSLEVCGTTSTTWTATKS